MSVNIITFKPILLYMPNTINIDHIGGVMVASRPQIKSLYFYVFF
jgi:hypothetical protein